MTAEDYLKQELVAGRLTYSDLVLATKLAQRALGLTGTDVDGMPGPVTRAALRKLAAPTSTPVPFRFGWPLPTLADGRRPLVTSAFRPRERPDHVGLDLFYDYKAGDQPGFTGDKGAAAWQGKPRWVVPYGVHAIAVADGVVQIAGNAPTGYRLWIDHGNGWRTGYFHLLNCRVQVGDRVVAGAELGEVGDNPIDHDGRHLHFELSPVDRYEPVDPRPHLA